MLLALVLFFDNRKLKDVNVVPSDVSPLRRRNYVWYALTGYGIGLVAALAAGILSQSPQPALLYLVSVVRLYSQVLDLDVIAFFFHSAKLCFSDLATCFMVYQSFKLWWDLYSMVVAVYSDRLWLSGAVNTGACHVLVMVPE
jgi:hypothetical protein